MISDHQFTDEELLAELLLDWEELRHTREPKTAEQLCEDRIDLVGELKRRIEALDQINRLILDTSPSDGRSAFGLDRVIASQIWPELPGYQILTEIGRGGMGVVYKALHESLNRLVAIKTIRSDKCSTSRLDDKGVEFRARSRREPFCKRARGGSAKCRFEKPSLGGSTRG